MRKQYLVRPLFVCVFIGAVNAALLGPAISQIVATANIEQLCKSTASITSRRTVVYVDVSVVKASKPEWGLTILNKLELAPREFLSVISVNPTTFEVREIFNSCLPSFTSVEIDETRKSRGMWDKLTALDPSDQQRENLQTFDARLRNALDRVLTDSQAYKEGKRRNVLGAIALDKNRYSDAGAQYRIIIYTDGTLREPTQDGESSPLTGPSLIERYPANFAGADVLVYGVEGSPQGTGVDAREQAYSAYFLKNWALLKAFSPSLPQQDSMAFSSPKRMDGAFDGGGAQGSVKLLLYTKKNGGNSATGWLAFNLGREMLYVPLNGEYQCLDADCRFVGSCMQAVPPLVQSPYFRAGDRISLAKAGPNLEGTLEPDAREVFKDGKQAVKYSLRFSFK